MAALDALPEVEKTSIFGTAVHAVLRRRDVSPDALGAALRRGRASTVRSLQPSTPSLEDVFLDVVERSRRREHDAAGAARAMARKELRQIGRDRRTLLILLFVPALFLLLYGYALNFDIRNIQLAVDDRDGSTASRALVSAFTELRLLHLRRPRCTAGGSSTG